MKSGESKGKTKTSDVVMDAYIDAGSLQHIMPQGVNIIRAVIHIQDGRVKRVVCEYADPLGTL
jgi:hypothetical protein